MENTVRKAFSPPPTSSNPTEVTLRPDSRMGSMHRTSISRSSTEEIRTSSSALVPATESSTFRLRFWSKWSGKTWSIQNQQGHTISLPNETNLTEREKPMLTPRQLEEAHKKIRWFKVKLKNFWVRSLLFGQRTTTEVAGLQMIPHPITSLNINTTILEGILSQLVLALTMPLHIVLSLLQLEVHSVYGQGICWCFLSWCSSNWTMVEKFWVHLLKLHLFDCVNAAMVRWSLNVSPAEVVQVIVKQIRGIGYFIICCRMVNRPLCKEVLSPKSALRLLVAHS